MVSTLFKSLIVCISLVASTSAWAGDIYTSVGKPGSIDWHNNCPNPWINKLPSFNDNLASCDPTTEHCLERVTIDTSIHTDATCNDGSPGTFYIRPGRNADQDKWVVHLQGGLYCMNAKECLQRWCGEQGIYSADNMSSNWDQSNAADASVPAYAQYSDMLKHASAEGIFRDDDTNAFKDWTHVWVYYCSSDNWSGRTSDVLYTHNGLNFEVDHQGHNILKAVRKILRQAVGAGNNETDDGSPLPDIDTASHVVLSGTSAGAYGAMQHADWFFSTMSSNIDQKHYLVLDGGMETTKEQATYFELNIDQLGIVSTYGQWRKAIEVDAWSGGYYEKINAFVDVSCGNEYPSNAQRHHCSAGGRLLSSDVNQISTPTFIRYDLEDQVLSKPWGNTAPNLIVLRDTIATNLDDHATILNRALTELYDSNNSITGVFAPRCGDHVGLEKNDPFFGHVTAHYDLNYLPPYYAAVYGPVANSESNFEQALLDWLNLSGASPTPIVVIDGKYTTDTSSACDPAP